MWFAERRSDRRDWRRRPGLVFADAGREARYRASRRAWLEKRFLSLAAFASAIFLAFIFLDWIFARDHWSALVWARLGTASAILAVGFLIHVRIPGLSVNKVACAAVIFAYAGVFWSRLIAGNEVPYNFAAAMMLVQVGVWFLGVVRFLYAAVINVLAAAAFVTFEYLVMGTPADRVLITAIDLSGLLFIGSLAAWNVERLFRRQFATAEDLDEERRESEARALRDGLTGLWNRPAMDAKLAEACRRSAETGRPGAVMIVDLDDFKPVNDEFGHDAGDDVLVTVSRRMQGALRIGDSVGRVGGDEFRVIVEDLPDEKLAHELAERLRTSVKAPIRVRRFGDSVGAEVKVGCSIGIGIFRGDAVSPEQILVAADRELYRDKVERKKGVSEG